MKKISNVLLSITLLSMMFACGGNTSSISSSTSSGSESSQETSSSSSLSSSESSSSSSSSEEIKELKDYIEEGLAGSSKIKSGSLRYRTSSVKDYDYEYGQDQYGDFVCIAEKHFSTYYGLNASGETYGLKVQNNTLSSPNEIGNVNYLKGPAIQPYGSSYETLCGVTGLMEYMLTLIEDDANLDFVDLSSNDEYKFSIGKIIEDNRAFMWVNTISFTLENGAFNKVNATFERYTDITKDYELDGVYYLNEGAEPTHTYSAAYTQTLGERSLENPYDIETYYFNSFELEDEEGNIVEDSISLVAGESKVLSIASKSPETANENIDKLSLTNVSENNEITGTFSNGKLSISSETDGSFEVKISSKKVTKTIMVNVTKSAPTSMTVLYYLKSGNDYSVDLLFESKTSINTYVGSEIFIRATFLPNNADQECTLELVEDNENIQLDITEILPYETAKEKVKVFKIVANASGIYKFRIGSNSNELLTNTFDLVVEDVPDLSELLSRRYVNVAGADILVDVQFTPDESDIKTGKVYVNDQNGEEGTYNYSYDISTKKFALTNDAEENIDSFSLEFNGNYTIVYTRKGASSVPLREYSTRLMLSNGEWTGGSNEDGRISITFDVESNTGEFHYSKLDANFNPIASFSCETAYIIEENGDEYDIIFDQDTIDQITASGYFTEVKSVTVNSEFTSLIAELTMSVGDVTFACQRTR